MTDRKERPSYTVHRAADFSYDPPDARPWASIPPLAVDRYLWLENGYRPRVEARLCWSPRFLYVRFRVEEKRVRVRYTKFQDPIYKNSCVEFFVDMFPATWNRRLEMELGNLATFYLIGSIPVAWLVAKLADDEDICEQGSGNAGVMNVAINVSRIACLIVFLAEIAKGVFTVLLAQRWGLGEWMTGLAVVAAVTGTRWSIWLNGRGGRGNTLGIAALLMLAWQAVVISLAIWVIARILTRSSFWATRGWLLALPLTMGLVTMSWAYVVTGALLALLYLSMHKTGTDDHAIIKKVTPACGIFLHIGSSPAVEMQTVLQRSLLAAEAHRREVWAGRERPLLSPGAPATLERRADALALLAAKDAAGAGRLLDEAAAAGVAVAGTLNGEPFDQLRDSADFSASVLEVFAQGNCLWLSLEQLRRLEVQKPETLLDLLWPRAKLLDARGNDAVVHLPALYAGSHAHPDGTHRTGRATSWEEAPGVGAVRGAGQTISRDQSRQP